MNNLKDDLVKLQIDAFNLSVKRTEKYVLKDSLNTYISMHDTEDEVFDKLQEFSKNLKILSQPLGQVLTTILEKQDLPTKIVQFLQFLRN